MAEEGGQDGATAAVAGSSRKAADASKAAGSPPATKEHVRAAPSDGKTERQDSAKRPRKPDSDLAQRGKRMFGLLNSTLSKAKEDNARRSSGEAAKRRAEIEAKALEKLKAEEETIKQSTELAERLKTQLQAAYDLALEIQSTESTIRLRKVQKRRLASFLVTPSYSAKADGEQAKRMAIDGRILESDVACCLAPLPYRPAPDPPVYFLPKKMLPKQDDILDDQEDRVDDAIEEADKAWEKEKAVMEEKLATLQAEIQTIQQQLTAVAPGQQQPTADSGQ